MSNSTEDSGLLKSTLSVAVPLWIERVRGYSEADRLARGRQCAQAVAERGDRVLYRSNKRGETAAAFNALAEGIACAAFQPGGIRAFGLHFEAEPPPARAEATGASHC